MFGTKVQKASKIDMAVEMIDRAGTDVSTADIITLVEQQFGVKISADTVRGARKRFAEQVVAEDEAKSDVTDETPKVKRPGTGEGTGVRGGERCGNETASGPCRRPAGHPHGCMSQKVYDVKRANDKAKRVAAKAAANA